MPSTNVLMLRAARAFLAALSPAQRAEAQIPFDDVERFTWHFTPIPRRGLPFRDMLPAQQKLAYALVSSGYSQTGAGKALQIMSLDQVLHEFETVRRFVRDPDLYFVTVFGEPSEDKTWGWRLEGHHVSLSISLVDGQAIASTPCFLGANPAEVRQGPRAGLRVLADEEDLARAILHTLDASQQRQAVFDLAAPNDIISFNHKRAEYLGDAGISAADLDGGQRGRLMELLDVYASAVPEEVAAARMKKVRAAKSTDMRFAWAGGKERGERHYYRIQSPEILVEYDNTQDGANHIHSVWRDFDGDWGLDLLGLHLVEAHSVAGSGASMAARTAQ
ncbi:MAG: DUF3500 domain-containing protein [Actinomycetota bacterium]|nr:DUF3500 domain-containing protein [Actinomycetota bacterium]